VLLSTKHFKPPEGKKRRKTLAAKFAAPYEIIQVVSSVAYKLALPPGTNAHPVFHAGLLRPYFPDATGLRIPKAPEPVVVIRQVEDLVETILDSTMVRNKTQSLVKWKGYPTYESTWEPEENVQGSEAIEDFQARRK
jgi:Chromo (CHRromatin Organisation MOdifier) domain